MIFDFINAMKENNYNLDKAFFSNPGVSNEEKHHMFVEAGYFDNLPAVKPKVGLLVVCRDEGTMWQITSINSDGGLEIKCSKDGIERGRFIHDLRDLRLATDVGNALLRIRGYGNVLEFKQKGTDTFMGPKVINN